MEVREVALEQEGLDWNALVASVKEGTIYQTTYWADYIRRNEGGESVFLIARNDRGDIVGSLLAFGTVSFRWLLRYGILGGILYRLFNSKKIAMTWLYGPIVYDKERFEDVFSSLIDGVEKIAKKRGVLFLRAASYPIHGDGVYFQRAPRILSTKGFKERQMATIFLKLEKDEEELWKGLKNSARKAIKKSSSIGVDAGFLGREELKGYHDMLCESRKRVGIELPPTYPNEAMWDCLGGDDDRLKIFCVKDGGRLLAAIGITSFNGIIFETGPAQSNYSYDNKIYGNDILKWEVIKWGWENKSRLYDLSGISPEVKNEKEKGKCNLRKNGVAG